MRFFALLPAALLASFGLAQKPLTLTILHSNDIHAHLEPSPIRGKTYGGLARISTIIKQVRAKEKNVILLNAGDAFQGTLYFNIYDGLAESMMLNKLGYNASCIGNHEFDKGIPNLVNYAKHLNFPLLASNIDMSKEPEMAKVVKPYTVLMVDNQKIGVVGLITDTTGNITLGADSLKFLPHLVPCQKSVDELTNQGVNKIIVLSHIGYEEDQELAARLHNVDLIVGGHSHTPLGTPDLPGWRPSGGPYPTYVKDADGKSVPIVQAWEWGKVFGDIKVEFDAKGALTKVDEAKAIVVDESIPEDPEIANIMDVLRKPVTAMGGMVLGPSTAPYDKNLVGYFVADSYLQATSKLGAEVAFMNPGGVRSNLEAGKITFSAANSVCPFRNSLVLADMTGAEIVKLLNDSKGSLIPSKGTSFNAGGGSVSNVVIGGQPLDQTKTYKVVVNNFMAGGGDNLDMLKTCTKKLDTGLNDIDAFVDYIKANSPLNVGSEQRIKR